jgi:AcrR family transcriptional regulator
MTSAPRRKQSDRSQEMRARLAKAAYEVIAERGHSAFRTAAVLAHAGVSQGAMLHHFPTKDSLTLAAIHYALNLGNEASLARIATAGATPAQIVQAMSDDFRDFFSGDRFWVSLDITMDAAKDATVAPAIRQIVGEARRPIYAQWALALCAAGWQPERATEAVTMTAALVSGYAIRLLWTDERQALDKALARLFICLLQE